MKWKQNNECEQEREHQEIQFHDNGHALNLFEPIFSLFSMDFFYVLLALLLLHMWTHIFVLCIFGMFLIEKSMLLID